MEGADDRKGVECLGGECLGVAGQGFLRSAARTDTSDSGRQWRFFAEALTRRDRRAEY